MREIKFRVWCKNRNEWETDDIAILPNGFIRHTHIGRGKDFPCYIKAETHPIMSYTGRKDKNGKEIYDGDVVIAKDDNNEYFPEELNEATDEYEPTGRYEVYWDEGYFWLRDKDKKAVECGWNVFGDNVEIEIIGNIYETPEFLERNGK